MIAKIGPYLILDAIHSGSRPLFKVKDREGRTVALKAVAEAGLLPEMRERFLREADICRELHHPNLVRVYDAGEADGYLYQVMELLEGSDLNAALASGRQFTWPEKLSIMEQVCAGLEFAHERKLVHRDIKPANLFIENSGRIRVLDFGMARVDQSQLTRVGSAVGTLNYMAPEQVRGETCTAASDVFSAGIVFFQLASGRHPFSSRESSISQVVSAIVFEAPPKLSQICPDAPEGLEFLLNKALEKLPANRPQNGSELRQAVTYCQITMDLPPLPPQEPAPLDRPEPAPPAAGNDFVAEGVKTKILDRSKLVKPVLPAAPAPVPVPAAPRTPKYSPPTGELQKQFRFCPACTFANTLAATVCAGCGFPLVNDASGSRRETRRPWPLYIAIAVAGVLAVALIVVLLVKN